MTVASFFLNNAHIIIFYLIVAILIYINRKKINFEGKIIAMYRTKVGIKLMQRWGTKAEKFVKGLALGGIVIGFLGMGFIVWMILHGLYDLVMNPSAPATFAPVIPGVRIPGVDIFIPFFYGMIALFVTIVVHEFSHGVVAEAFKLKIKNTGLVMFGPLPGAFVEPDEKQLMKKKARVQLSVYAAGPFSNILLTILLIILFGFIPLFVVEMGGSPSPALETVTKYTSIVNLYQVRTELYDPVGVEILTVTDGSAAADAGLANHTIITSINGHDVRMNKTLFGEEYEKLFNLTPGETVTLSNDTASFIIIAKPHPENASRGQMGVIMTPVPAALEKYGKFGIAFFDILFNQILWIIILSSGVGFANLLPIGPVDGGRMLLVALEQRFDKEKAKDIWGRISLITLVCVLLLLFVPIIRNLIG
jgi:membrane-associated protease RseP (regulator of RpoE activity)